MNFANTLLKWLNNIITFIADGFGKLFRFLEKPLSYLFYFFDGIFYFIAVVFDIIVAIVRIFVALFQFIGALILGVLRTIADFLVPSFSSPVHMPSESGNGFGVVLDVVDPVGLLHIVPYILIALVWFAFIFKILALFGGNLSVRGGD